MREKLQEARDVSYGEEKRSYSKPLDLLNRKGEENDMEPVISIKQCHLGISRSQMENHVILNIKISNIHSYQGS